MVPGGGKGGHAPPTNPFGNFQIPLSGSLHRYNRVGNQLLTATSGPKGLLDFAPREADSSIKIQKKAIFFTENPNFSSIKTLSFQILSLKTQIFKFSLRKTQHFQIFSKKNTKFLVRLIHQKICLCHPTGSCCLGQGFMMLPPGACFPLPYLSNPGTTPGNGIFDSHKCYHFFVW